MINHRAVHTAVYCASQLPFCMSAVAWKMPRLLKAAFALGAGSTRGCPSQTHPALVQKTAMLMGKACMP